MAACDVFMVFVDGKPGHEEDYARWFLGGHLADMRQLPGVTQAFSGHLTSLDGAASPAGLCALYDTPDGGSLLKTIAASKGTAALPESDLQGAMVWRVLETVGAVSTEGVGDAQPEGPVLICMCSDEIDGSLLPVLLDEHSGVKAARHMRISPIQPSRGREYSDFLLLDLEPGSDPADITSKLMSHVGSDATRCLLVST